MLGPFKLSSWGTSSLWFSDDSNINTQHRCTAVAAANDGSQLEPSVPSKTHNVACCTLPGYMSWP